MSEILFPRNISCIFCSMPISRQNAYSICRECFENMEFIKEICTNCGRTGEHSRLCTFCHGDRYYFDRVYSILKYNDFMHGKIYGYKYGHRNYLSRYFAQMANDFIKANSLNYDFVTGVPISRKRMRSRGFNQTYVIAEKLDESEKYIELFERKRHTAFLSRLPDSQRKSEIKGAFEIKTESLDRMLEKFHSETCPDSIERNLRILIFDDIFTTGTTMNELASLLKKSIADVEVSCLTLCNARIINKNETKKPASKI